MTESRILTPEEIKKKRVDQLKWGGFVAGGIGALALMNFAKGELAAVGAVASAVFLLSPLIEIGVESVKDFINPNRHNVLPK